MSAYDKPLRRHSREEVLAEWRRQAADPAVRAAIRNLDEGAYTVSAPESEGMNDVRLPDGTRVTTPVGIGPGAAEFPCPDDTCVWEDFGPPTPLDFPLPTQLQLQKCAQCKFVRGRYLGNPDPEVADDGK